MAVAAALREIAIQPGDVVALNDPFAGGTHLPDVTLISGVYAEAVMRRRGDGATGRQVTGAAKGKIAAQGAGPGITSPRLRVRLSPRHPVGLSPRRSVTPSLLFYVANRAHHADIGGATPGSMGLATDIYGEGIRIPPIRIVRGGEVDADIMRLLMANVRGNNERRGDFDAQIGSLQYWCDAFLKSSIAEVRKRPASMPRNSLNTSARLMRHTISAIPDGIYEAQDALDDDGISDSRFLLS